MELRPALINAWYLRALNYGASCTYENTVNAMKRTAELGYAPARKLLESHTAQPEMNGGRSPLCRRYALLHLLLVKGDGSSQLTVTTANVNRDACSSDTLITVASSALGRHARYAAKTSWTPTAIRGLRTQPYSG